MAWENADDFYEPNVFGLVMRVFQKHPIVRLVYGNVRLVDEDSRQIGEMRSMPTNYWSTLFEGSAMHSQAAFLRRSVWDAMGAITFLIGISTMTCSSEPPALRESSLFIRRWVIIVITLGLAVFFGVPQASGIKPLDHAQQAFR